MKAVLSEVLRVKKICLMVTLLFFLSSWEQASASISDVDSLYQTAVGQLGHMSVEASLEAFKRVLEVAPDYATAHYQMARLYIVLGTPNDHQRADRAIKEAIRLDRENEEYQLTLADLMWEKGFRFNAEQQYLKVLKLYPGSAKAAFGIGLRALKHFLKYQDMRDSEKLVDTVVLFHWGHFAEKDRRKAISYLQQSISLDPEFSDAYYQLGLAHFENSRPDSLLVVSERLLTVKTEDKDALLYCGLAYQKLDDEKAAYQCYLKAIAQMGPEEWTVMESIEDLMPEGERDVLGTAMERVASGGAEPTLDAFWRKQDPLHLTPFNERRMAHYGRVAYANLRFSRVEKGIPGWQTDMGRSYIKFGRWRGKVAQRPEVNMTGAGLVLTPHTETWFYEGFKLTFRNMDGLDGWAFDWTYHGVADPAAREVFKKKAPRYVDPYARQKYRMPNQVAAFREGEGVRVEIAYALPKTRLRLSEPEGLVNLESGVFLFDAAWQTVYRKTDEAVLKYPVSGVEKQRASTYALQERTLRIKPGTYHLVGEVVDLEAKSIGTFQTFRDFAFPGTFLAASDLLLASHIEEIDGFPEGRSDLKIQANPLRTFTRGQSVYIYLEVYNLKQDTFGRTDYEISYRVGRPDEETVDSALFAAVDSSPQGVVEIEPVFRGEDVDYRVRYVLPQGNRFARQIKGMDAAETAVTVRYEGDQKDDFTYLQVDVSQASVGIQKLTVNITDRQTGQTEEREVLFRVID